MTLVGIRSTASVAIEKLSGHILYLAIVVMFPKSVGNAIYNTFMRSNSVYIATILAGAFVAERTFNGAIDAWWDKNNSGKQWKDIKPADA